VTDPPTSLVALRLRREQTIARLCDHFARDHLEAEELEQLIDRAHAAVTLAELDGLLEGLPSLDAPASHPEEVAARPLARPQDRDHQVVIAVMGGAERRGAWTPARNLYVTAVMGGVLLDFRDAVLDPGVTEIFVLALMGGVEIVVPPGVFVESNGIGIMGGFGGSGASKYPTDGSAPVLRVSGLALMGGVEIKQRPPRQVIRGSGEEHGSDRRHELRQQLREQRKELKEEIRRARRGLPPHEG
jgi:uncharacterized membrane protein